MSHTVIIGANRGIGLSMARIMAERGDSVTATARDPERADDLNALAQKTGKITVHALDAVDQASIDAFAAFVTDPVDLLVCNAGVLNSYGGLDDADHSVDAWRDVLMTNVAGPYLVTRAFVPHLARGKDAKITIISSIMGSSAHASGNAYPYRTSKAAAANLALNLSVELKGRKIAVGAYHPGWVRTDMGGQRADISPEESAEGLVKRFDALSMASTGVFEDYRGKALSF